MSETNFAETIADLAHAGTQAKLIPTADKRLFMSLPEGVTLKEVTDPHGLIVTAPIRIVTVVKVQTVDSLVDYVDRFKGQTSLLLADIAHDRIRAVIDYHGAGDPQHLQHSALMDLPFSIEWKAWGAIDGKMLTQLDFARFIEENAVDVVAPAGADLLEIVRDLQALRKVDFRKVVRTSSNNESIEYAETTAAGATTKNGKVDLPTEFKLSIPVYFGGESVSLFAKLRWHLDEGTLRLGVALHRAEAVRQAVFQQLVEDISERTGLLAVYGALSPVRDGTA